MARIIFRSLLAPAMVVVGSAAGFAQDSPKHLFAKTIATYPAPKLAEVNSREFKHLFDPAKTKGTPEAAFKDLWGQIKGAATKAGFEVTEKEKNPLKMEMSTKEYFDTPDQMLWKKGYLIRITTKYVGGSADTSGKVTIKAINEDALKTLATPLEVVGVKSESECQDNVGMSYGGQLAGYVEKGSSYSIKLSELGAMTLGNFGKYMPELLKLGLPADTKLISTKAYSYRVRPGYVVLPGTEPCGISMEGWTTKEAGTPYLYDFSYGYEDVEFYGNAPIHTAGENFLQKVICGELGNLAMPDGERWGGSKVRKLMNRPINK